MERIFHQSNSRGHANHGWLDTRHTFSFANYYDPSRIHFGNLRVLNDDIIEGYKGFGLHPHDNMEIISVPVDGYLKHTDSMGHEQIIGPDEVQVMSAGTGIFHSEYNATDQPANFLQLWIFPAKKQVTPRYDQQRFDRAGALNQWQLLVSGDGQAPLTINQNARISRIDLDENTSIDYELQAGSFGSYLFVIEGQIEVEGSLLSRRDGLGLSKISRFSLSGITKSTVLNIEV